MFFTSNNIEKKISEKKNVLLSTILKIGKMYLDVLSEKAICREDRKANQALRFVNNHEENLVSPRDSKSADSL